MTRQMLNLIALRPDPLTQPAFIDMLIEHEQMEKQPGYKARIGEYEAAKRVGVSVYPLTSK